MGKGALPQERARSLPCVTLSVLTLVLRKLRQEPPSCASIPSPRAFSQHIHHPLPTSTIPHPAVLWFTAHRHFQKSSPGLPPKNPKGFLGSLKKLLMEKQQAQHRQGETLPRQRLAQGPPSLWNKFLDRHQRFSRLYCRDFLALVSGSQGSCVAVPPPEKSIPSS